MIKFKIEQQKFVELVSLYQQRKLNLNPPYQRNSIWSINAQKLLIDTIRKGLPLPTFFVQKKNDIIEMVDGQQRTRTFISYLSPDGFLDSNGKQYSVGEFDDYEIAVVELSETLTMDEVREFYVRVNRAGAKLERPELNKAEFFKTKFLKLSTELSEMVEFRQLKVFKSSHIRRMFDRDFIEELAALILYGPQDKKTMVDQMYKEDISDNDVNKINTTFKSVLDKVSILNQEIPLSDTRFVQKNDFYTLFNLIIEITLLENDDLKKIYKVLVAISRGISPSNDECQTLKDYAINCVTQSNSKRARNKRLEILKSLLLNESSKMNSPQVDVATFFKLPNELQHIGTYFTFNV
ncbi:MAG: DUF262 domain-containing protein [Ferruginibacter sp.]